MKRKKKVVEEGKEQERKAGIKGNWRKRMEQKKRRWNQNN